MHSIIHLEAELRLSPAEAIVLDMALQALDNTDNPVIQGTRDGVKAIVDGFEQNLTPEAMRQMRAHAGVVKLGDISE